MGVVEVWFMNKRLMTAWLCVVAMAGVCAAQDKGAGEIRLLVRGDEMGVAHAGNEACIKSYREGIVRSVEVMAPGQWFLEAAKMCNENPGLDVGVHLTLTSEWEVCKWRPVTHGGSLVDGNGYLHPTTKGFLDGKPKLEEVEAELRGQIELARKHIKNVSHLSLHMGTPTATPELRKIAEKLAGEYGLILETVPTAQRPPGFGGAKTPEEKEAKLVEIVQNLGPGLWLFVEHPGFDVPEMQGMGHKGYEFVAADREGVTRAFTSEKVKQVIERRGIKLVSYAEAAGKK
jgi:hypothetical protein